MGCGAWTEKRHIVSACVCLPTWVASWLVSILFTTSKLKTKYTIIKEDIGAVIGMATMHVRRARTWIKFLPTMHVRWGKRGEVGKLAISRLAWEMHCTPFAIYVHSPSLSDYTGGYYVHKNSQNLLSMYMYTGHSEVTGSYMFDLAVHMEGSLCC